MSHLQSELVGLLLYDLAKLVDPTSIEVILTRNLPEQLNFSPKDFPFKVKLVDNASPQGFGANHNAAFRHASGNWYCVMNPDIRIEINPFPALLSCLSGVEVGLVGPVVMSPDRVREDSVRRFPTPLRLLAKFLGLSDGRYVIPEGVPSMPVDWVAGMFMLIRAEDFKNVGGFDDRFFLYYEDVDLCARFWKSGQQVIACTGVAVFHDARRASRRNFRYMRWHLSSMLRFFRKHYGRIPDPTGSEAKAKSMLP